MFPKIGAPQNGWFISWKTLLFNGWCGGKTTPCLFLNIHIEFLVSTQKPQNHLQAGGWVGCFMLIVYYYSMHSLSLTNIKPPAISLHHPRSLTKLALEKCWDWKTIYFPIGFRPLFRGEFCSYRSAIKHPSFSFSSSNVWKNNTTPPKKRKMTGWKWGDSFVGKWEILFCW